MVINALKKALKVSKSKSLSSTKGVNLQATNALCCYETNSILGYVITKIIVMTTELLETYFSSVTFNNILRIIVE